MATKEELLQYTSVIDEKKESLDALSMYLWENPETAFTEFKSAACITKYLREEGFEVTENLTNIATAFKGVYGHGKPVIGFLCEYDALAGLQQVGGVTTKQLIPGQNCGQGCGHNLLGMGAIAGAVAAKNYLEKTGHEGTVILFGTPGEEGGSGKAFMARDGAFDGVDACITWHPAAGTNTRNSTALANYQVKYIFDGKAAHAGGTPHLGRSALDAVELMNVGVQFLREHVTDDCRIHYAITDTGGFSPNVVQPHAEVLYLIRAVTNPEVKDLYDRINDIAKGAALMTGTTEHHDFIKACSNVVINHTLCDVMQSVFDDIEHPKCSKEHQDFCRELMKSMEGTGAKVDEELPVHDSVAPMPEYTIGHGSTDVGDASWCCPTVQCSGATWAVATPGHSWQAVSQGSTEWAHDVARYCGKVMAGTAIHLFEEPETLKKAWDEHRENVGPNGYEAPIPKDVVPRAINNI